MELDYTAYLTKLNDKELGLFWIIASPNARQWIKEELLRRAATRGEVPVAESARMNRQAVAAA